MYEKLNFIFYIVTANVISKLYHLSDFKEAIF